MFFSLILENSAGDQIDMTATANQYLILSIILDTILKKLKAEPE